MTDRLNKIFSSLPNCKVFADIGCDHGYIAKAMIKSGKCDRVIISDISEKCLEKAKELLSDEIALGRAKSVVADGFNGVVGADLALIAGMGGKEIISILEKAQSLPEKLVLQPMKNCKEVRKCVLKLGYRIELDYVFKSANKYYDLIVLQKGEDFLSEEELEFGRTNIREKGTDFIQRIKEEIKKANGYLSASVSEKTRQEITENIKKLEKYV